jgi:hypothetical protein
MTGPDERTDHPDDGRSDDPVAATTPPGTGTAATVAGPALTIAALASLAAGGIHAVASGVHPEHPPAQVAFTAVALFQLGWGALALARPARWVAAVGAAGQLAALGGWLLAKTSGIAFVDGLDRAEPVRSADGAAAALAALALAGTAVALSGLSRRPVTPRLGYGLTAGAAATALVLATWGMATTGGTVGDGHHGPAADQAAADDADADHAGADHESTTEDGLPFDPVRPIDLSGMPGVTPEQQARAENLLAVTLDRLPRYADPAAAEADGFRSIGDAATGDEHFINFDYIDDEHILNPDYPESLVYRVQGGQRTLAAAMFTLNSGDTLDDVPDVGGDLMQWHVHGNLCFTTDTETPKVRGTRATGQPCPDGLSPGPEMPMIHVWIVPHPCGPFAALDGIGGGSVPEGEERLCDAAHGAHGT